MPIMILRQTFSPHAARRLIKVLLPAMLILTSCATPPADGSRTGSSGVRSALKATSATAEEAPQALREARTGITIRPTRPLRQSVDLATEDVSADLPDEPVEGSFDQVTLPAFVNAVFGDLLNVPFEIAPDLANRNEVITLRTGPLDSGDDLLALARQVLATYGIDVVEKNGLFRIVGSEQLRTEVPFLIRSRSAVDVPAGLRPVFQFVDLLSLEPNIAQELINSSLGDRVTVKPIGAMTAVVLMGLPRDVASALDILKVMDQPQFTRSRSARVEPVYWTATDFARRLADVLITEGFKVATNPGQPGSLAVMAVDRIGAVLVFAPDEATLGTALAWARELDSPAETGQSNGIFFYHVQNTQARSLAEVAELLSIVGGSARPDTGSAAGAAAPDVSTGRGRLVVDEARNLLIFEGSSDDFSRLRPVLSRLDQPPREVLIEVTIAEVSLDDSTALGVDWLIRESGIFDGQDLTIGTRGGVGLPSGGLSVRLLQGADIRLAINAAARNSRINILSTPRIVARSGEEATIQVGSEVPIITSQQVSEQQTGGSSNLIQNIQYRRTDVLLGVKPVVHSGNRVELAVDQEVSEARENPNPSIGSPIILNRTVRTSLSLTDGSTAVLGGLIQDNETIGENGVPLLKDIPFLGTAFRSQTRSKQKTELVVLITPYIVETADEAQAIARALSARVDAIANQPLRTIPLEGSSLTPIQEDERAAP